VMEENPNYNEYTETPLDRIRASFFGDGDNPDAGLSQQELDHKGQLVCAHANRTEGKSLEKTVKLLIARYGISRTTAYQRCRDASTLFADVTRTHKEGERQFQYEMAMKTWRLAMKNGDAKGANGAQANMIKLKGLDKEDSAALTPDVLGNKTYYLTVQVGEGKGKTKNIDLGNLESIDDGTYAELVEAVESTDLPLLGMKKLLLEAKQKGGEENDDESTSG
jgi:hypothetical protein